MMRMAFVMRLGWARWPVAWVGLWIVSVAPDPALACPPGWQCLPGKSCPPIEHCVPQSTPPPEPPVPAPEPDPIVLPPAPEPVPTEPPPEPMPTPSPAPSPEPPVTQPPTTAPPSDPPIDPPIDPEGEPPSEPPQTEPPATAPPVTEPPTTKTPPTSTTPTVGYRLRPGYNTEEALDQQRESQDRARESLDRVHVIGTRIPRRLKDAELLSGQIGRLQGLMEEAEEDDWTTTVPEYEQGITPETPVGIVLKRASDNWIPEYGNRTRVIAKLYVPDPEREGVWLPSYTVVRQITVRFTERSNEPGIALNADLKRDPRLSPDLFFGSAQNPHATCTDDPVGVGYYGRCVTLGQHNEVTFYISSADYGGYSKLDASCPGCVPLARVPGAYPEAFDRNQFWELAVTEPDINKRAVKVPKDTNNNQISDGYLPDRIEYMSPSEDSETDPAGNGTAGDGLGAYEEYRGVITRSGRHRRTNWWRKTLFIENIHQISTGQFKRQSGLEVVELESDGHRGRIVNFNHGHGHVVEQHGLILRMMASLDDGFAGYCFCDLERPKTSRRVVVKPAYRHSSTVAHELGHAVGMQHHGNVAWPEKEEIRAMTGTWRDLLPGRVHSGPQLCGKNLPAMFEVGTKGDQGSGHHHCIMRYRHYHYVYEQAGGDYDCMPYESRRLFDDSAVGTGPNRMGRTAGDATNGNCKGQIWISSQ